MSAADIHGPILVTGATGFIGSRIVARLAHTGVDVHALRRPSSNPWRLSSAALNGCATGSGERVHSHTVDLCDRAEVSSLVRDIGPRTVFHLATYRSIDGHDDSRAAFATNVQGLMNLIDGCEATLSRLVHFSSSTEYGRMERPAAEDAPLQPATIHGASKAAATIVCRQQALAHGLPAVILRLFHVYGPWDRTTRFIPRLVNAAIEGSAIALTPAGFAHDWTFVEDVVDASLRAAVASVADGEVINVASGRQRTNEEVHAAVERLTGRPIRVEQTPHPPRPWDAPCWVADTAKAARMLKWVPAHDFESGLAKTIEWAVAHRETSYAS